MLPSIKISACLLKRLEGVKQQCSGCLFGVFYGEGTLLLLGFNVESTIGKFNYEKIQYKFPAEVDLCGLVKFGDCTDAEAHLNEILKDVDITDNPILLHCELGTLVGLKASIFMHGKLHEIPYDVLETKDLYNEFCFTRLKCFLKIFTGQTLQDIRHQVQILRKTVSNGSLSFQIDLSNMYITNVGVNISHSYTHCLTNATIFDVIQSLIDIIETQKADKEDCFKIKKRGCGRKLKLSNIYGALGCDFDILYINVLQCKTKDSPALPTEMLTSSLPTLSMHMICKERKVCVPLEVEAMAMLSKTTKVSRLYGVLIESICRSLRLLEHSICENLENDQLIHLRVPRCFYFFPKEFGHFLSCSYLDGVSDDESSMQEKRKRLHRHFGLPLTRPYFRKSNHCIFWNDINPDEPLWNVHLGVRPISVSDGQQYMVTGNYLYYHYMQQNIQDNGWGCAYRSLQTICSWFLLQGYTERPVPTHSEIQQYLVRIGDKPKSFENSTKWIGSTEVSICLQGFLNVESKIQHIKSGYEMISIAPELVSHFILQGTPIMIGGGVLAHTIIGIDFSAQTGRVKFLVLDPHYAGSDDIHTILTKGWCGWKGVEFWGGKSYYNLCMPQRPILF